MGDDIAEVTVTLMLVAGVMWWVQRLIVWGVLEIHRAW